MSAVDGGPRATAAGAARRELTVAVLGSAAAGGLALSSSSQAWAELTVTRQPPLPSSTDVLTGGQAAPLVPACGLLLLAAAVALFAVRGPGRVVVGLLMALAGGALGVSGVRGLTGGIGTDPGDLDGVGLGDARVDTAVTAGWPLLALLAGVLALAAGLLVVLRGRRWPGLGRRYERAPDAAAAGTVQGTAAGTAQGTAPPRAARRPARPESAEDRHQAAWKALDRGEDPTA